MPTFSRRSFAPQAVALAAVSLCCGAAQGQFAPSNPPVTFFLLPTSTMGVITGNTLVLTPLVNGFVISGQVTVTIPAGPVSGTLVQWTVIRRIDPAFSGSGLQTQTVLTGFSAPPAGTFGTTTGTVLTDWRFMAGGVGFVGGSQSTVPMTLVNGVDSPAWSALTDTSPGGGFTWTAGFFPGAVMQQQFTLMGNYTSGPGGTWVIDVPVTSITIGGCPADFNGVDGATVQDIYDFLAAWSAQVGQPFGTADFNGQDGVTVQDIYDFLAAWNAGCA